jgi:hypothetical protein
MEENMNCKEHSHLMKMLEEITYFGEIGKQLETMIVSISNKKKKNYVLELFNTK